MPECIPKNIGNLSHTSAFSSTARKCCHSQEKDHRIRLQGDPEAVELDPPARVSRRTNARTVRPYHLARIHHEQWNERAERGEDQEANIGRVADLVLATPMIENSCYSRADHAAGVKDAPKHRNHATFLVLSRVTEHQRALRGPQETGTKTEHGAGTDHERVCLWEFVEDEVG